MSSPFSTAPLRVTIWILLVLWPHSANRLPGWAQENDPVTVPTNWPQFLGPLRTGHSPERGLNLNWSAAPPRTKWIAEPGAGYTSISIDDRRVFLGAQRDGTDFIRCYDRQTGREQWSYAIGPGYQDVQRQGPGPRATPTIDGQRVYGLGPSGDLFCLSVQDGRQVWKVNVFDKTGASDPAGENLYWGLSGSPLVVGDLVICQPGGDRGNSVAAFDKHSGAMVWKAANDYRSYASPLAVTLSGQRQILCYAGDALIGLQPTNGRILWRYGHQNQYKCNCANPVVLGDRVLVSTAYGGGSTLLKVDLTNERWSVTERWTSKRMQALFATPIVIDDLIFGCHGDLAVCTLRCLDLTTGELLWASRGPGRCSLIAAEGHLICLSEDGTLRVVEARRDRYVEKGKLEGLLRAKSWAGPALAGGHLFARDQQRLVCLDLRSQ